ncbi:MAG TPA: hypothetical protein V6D33_00925 [Cyanophyceae cyanobacterium]
MFFTSHNLSVSTDFLSVLKEQQNFLKTAFQRKQRVYDYSPCKSGKDYAFDRIESGTKGYMTGQCRGVKIGDYILLKEESGLSQYQVEQIDYYLSPPDMWIALLKKI